MAAHDRTDSHKMPVAKGISPDAVIEGAEHAAQVIDEHADAMEETLVKADEKLSHRLPKRLTKRNAALMNVGFTVSVVISAVLATLYLLEFASYVGQMSTTATVFFGLELALLAADAAGCLTIVVFDYNTHMRQARVIARITMVALLVTVLVSIVTSGLRWLQLLYLYQMGCIIAFQASTDSLMARNRTFRAPWTISTDKTRRDYIPLNFFNIFWVFVVACVAGLVVEVLYHAIVFGGYQDRAGMLWGPFSPSTGSALCS